MLINKSIGLEEKRNAIDKVLASETFARSEQLRHFLKYVCDLEIAGRGADINEYLIGVDVLHRPKGYSPGSDSSVRSRAHELRHRLERFYEKEAPDSPIRIELRRGSYTPVFTDASTPHSAAVTERPRPQKFAPEIESPRHRVPWPVIAAFAGGALLVLTAGSLWARLHSSSNPAYDPIVAEAWGPLAQPSGNVLICIGSTLYMMVRPNWQNTPNGPPRYKAFPELYSFFRQERPLREGVELYMHPTDNALDYGEMRAIVTATATLRSFGSSYQLLPERATSVASLRGRNTILLGNSQTSNIAHQELLRGAWTIDFEPSVSRIAIVNQKDRSQPPPFLGEYGRPGEPTWCCGLITVVPSEGSANNARTVVISGITPTGTDAAMDYFSSPAALRDLRQRFVRDGFAGFPSAYQVVVKCKSKDTFLLASEYAAHQVLARR